MSSIPKKGVAFRVTFPILDSTSTPTSVTGLDSQISKDQAAFAACTNEATQVGTSGWYYLDLTAAEMTADTVAIQVNHGTASVPPALLEFYPDEGRILSDIYDDALQVPAIAAQAQLIYDLAVQIAAHTQLITGGPVSIVSPVAQTGGAITALRADTWVIPFSAIGSLVGIDSAALHGESPRPACPMKPPNSWSAPQGGSRWSQEAPRPMPRWPRSASPMPRQGPARSPLRLRPRACSGREAPASTRSSASMAVWRRLSRAEAFSRHAGDGGADVGRLL
jgi:hypothetical protein